MEYDRRAESGERSAGDPRTRDVSDVPGGAVRDCGYTRRFDRSYVPPPRTGRRGRTRTAAHGEPRFAPLSPKGTRAATRRTPGRRGAQRRRDPTVCWGGRDVRATTQTRIIPRNLQRPVHPRHTVTTAASTAWLVWLHLRAHRGENLSVILTVIDDLASVGCASRYIGATQSRERNLNVQRWPFAIYAMTMRNKLVTALQVAPICPVLEPPFPQCSSTCEGSVSSHEKLSEP